MILSPVIAISDLTLKNQKYLLPKELKQINERDCKKKSNYRVP